MPAEVVLGLAITRAKMSTLKFDINDKEKKIEKRSSE
jgi:hypothetical protein